MAVILKRLASVQVLRRLLTFLSFVSLLLCVATCVLWLLSYKEYKMEYVYSDSYQTKLTAHNGRFELKRDLIFKTNPELERAAKMSRGEWLGFGFRSGLTTIWHPMQPGFSETTYFEQHGVWVPAWALAALTALLPGYQLRRRLRCRATERLRLRGLCPSCRYDLRASPERCPECGAMPARAAGRV